MVVLFFKKGFIFIIILQTLFWLRLANSSEEKILLSEQWPLNIIFLRVVKAPFPLAGD